MNMAPKNTFDLLVSRMVGWAMSMDAVAAADAAPTSGNFISK